MVLTGIYLSLINFRTNAKDIHALSLVRDNSSKIKAYYTKIAYYFQLRY